MIDYTVEIQHDVGDEVWQVQGPNSDTYLVRGPFTIEGFRINEKGEEYTVFYTVRMGPGDTFTTDGEDLRGSLREATKLLEQKRKAAKKPTRYVQMFGDMRVVPGTMEIRWDPPFDTRPLG